MVGLNANKLFSIVCKSPDLFPQVERLCTAVMSALCLSHKLTKFLIPLFQVMPKPVLTLLDFSFPLASSDLGAETLENEFLLNNMNLSKVRVYSVTKTMMSGGSRDVGNYAMAISIAYTVGRNCPCFTWDCFAPIAPTYHFIC